MNTETLFSSKTDQWETPQEFFDKLNKKYNFTLDVCATKENAKCKRFFTEDVDGLSQEWVGSVWMNPPYGRRIKHWIKKAYDSAISGKCFVVCLIPSRTDTSWWHDYVAKGDVFFIRGRLKFGNSKENAPFPSAIVVFDWRVIL